MNAKISDICRFCGDDKTKYFFSSFNSHGRKIIDSKERYEIFQCLNCRALFIFGIQTGPEYYRKYYAQDYYGESGKNGVVENIWSIIYRLFSSRKEKYIRKFFKNGKKVSILDIGCGRGDFLAGLDANVFDINGLEINPEGSAVCKIRNINVYEEPIEEVNFKGKKFDVVTLWHVVEHLENPLETFKNIFKILKNNGILVFQVPNNESLGLKWGKEYWFHLDSPRHLVIPNKKAVEKICRISGFKISGIKNEFYDYPLDLLWSVRKSPMKFLVYPLYPVFKMLSQEHLTFICKKYGK